MKLDPAVDDWASIRFDGGEVPHRARWQARADCIAGRAAGVAAVVGRLLARRSLRLRLDRLDEAAAVAAAGGLVAALTAPAALSLVTLTIVVHPYVSVPAGLGTLSAA